MSITAAWMEEIRESLNSHDVDRIVANFDENGEFFMAAGPEPHEERFVGRKVIGEVLQQRFSAAPDIRWVDSKTCLGCDLWEFRNGKVLRKDTYYKQVISS